jgi:hypothetical protein
MMNGTLRLFLTALSLSALATQSSAQLPAFPGAEGPGANASGGRGGDVYHVTNLLDDHDGTIPGSMRYGLATAPAGGRTIVFDIGGTLNLVADVHNSTHTWLRSGKGNITIAGQTAPGPGITITGQGAKLSGNNWILRHMKFRPGQDQSRPGTLTNDGIGNNLQNSVIDHVSVSWADDEGLSSTDAVDNTTVQYSVIGEGLNYNDHSFGSLISSEVDDAQLAYHHNLFIHNRSRNPRLGSEAGTGAITSFTNNVVYNWFGRAGYSITGRPSRTNFLSNYYIAGTNTRGTDDVFYSPDQNTIIFHDATNRVDMNKNGSVDGVVFGFSGQQFSGSYQEASTPFDVPSGHVQSSPDAVNQILDYVGAQWWDRDPIDNRLTDDVRNGTGFTINNITNAPQDPNYTYDSEGYPIYGVTERSEDFDIDEDGMPDAWEVKHGLDPNSPDNNGDFDNDGYTNLEEYINEIGAFPAPVAIEWLATDGRYARIQNWGISQTIPENTYTYWQPSRFDTAVIDNGTVTVDAVGQHAGNLLLATGPGDNAMLNITDGWLAVEDAPHGLSDGVTVIGDDAAATATLNLSGGRLVTGTLLKGPGGSFNFTGGELHAGLVGFDLDIAGGTIAPGSSVGITTVDGNATFSDNSTLRIDLDGNAADLLDVLGDLDLGTDTSLDIVEFGELTGTDFLIAQYTGTLTGQFASVTPGFTVDYDTPGQILLTVSDIVLAGDYNDDGVVSAADYVVWRNNLDGGSLQNETASLGTEPASLAIGLVAFACFGTKRFARR